MPTRSLNVVITGDSRDLERATKRSSGAMERLGKDTSLHARITSRGFTGIGLAARGMTAGFGAAALAGGYLTKQFVESNKVAKQTNAVLKSTHGEANVTAKAVSDLATQISRKTGIDDEAIQSGENLLLTFTNIHNETGRGNQIFTRATRTIADMSAALGQDTKSSAIQLGKALNDPIKGVTALQRVGVSFTQSQRDQIKTLVESGRTMDAQKLILRELKKEFGGSAEAIATPFDKLKVSAGNLAETLGGFLAPALSKAAGFVNRFLEQMQDGTGIGGKFVAWVKDAVSTLGNFGRRIANAFSGGDKDITTFGRNVRRILGTVGDAIRDLAVAIGQFVSDHREQIRRAGDILRHFAAVWSTVVADIIDDSIDRIRDQIRLITGTVSFMVKQTSAILRGDWKAAWENARHTVQNALRGDGGVVSTLNALRDPVGAAARKIAEAVIRGLINGFNSLEFRVRRKIVDAIGKAFKGIPGLLNDAAKGIGSDIGKKIAGGVKDLIPGGDGLGFLPPSAGALGGLMGADADLAPFANIGSRFGLQVTSGLRPGSITSSGNVSYHSSGDAIDESGPAAGMLGYFKFLKANFGSKLRELIHTPGGVGIKDGRPFTYTGQVAADHYDHVHVAYTGPFGDGPGRDAVSGFFGDARDAWGVEKDIAGSRKSRPKLAVGNSGGVWARYLPDQHKVVFHENLAKALAHPEDPDGWLKGLVTHEFAHAMQPWNPPMKKWEYEGGAEAFTKRFARRIWDRAKHPMRGPDSPAPGYAGYVKRVGREHSAEWVKHGQFTGDGLGRKARTGDGLGFSTIERLWLRAGGTRKIAPLMAHIAMAESGGDPRARNPSGASGLWQILGQPFRGNVFDPLTNARMAVWKYEHQGLSAWAASRSKWGKYIAGPGSTVTIGGGGSGGDNGGGGGGGTPRAPGPEHRPAVNRPFPSSGGSDFGPQGSTGRGARPIARTLRPNRKGIVFGKTPVAATDGDVGTEEFVEQALIDALAAQTAAADALRAATEAHTTALADVKGEIKRQTDFAEQYSKTSEFQKTKYIADLVSGALGRGVLGRSFTPGSGAEIAY